MTHRSLSRRKAISQGPAVAKPAAVPSPVAYPRREVSALPSITFEGVAYLFLLLVGLSLRLHDLTASPLSAEEGARALSAWHLLRGEVPGAWGEPTLVVSTAVTYLLFGASDLAARLVPALAGLGLVGGCWLLRRHLGRTEALVAALLLTVSPLLVQSSRSLAPEILVAALSLGLIACLLRFLQEQRASYLLLGAVLLGLLLLAGAPGVQVVLVLVCFVVFRLALGSDPWLQAGLSGAVRERGPGLPALAVLGGTFLVVGTGFFLYPQGVGAASLGSWIGQFSLAEGGLPWHYHLQVLVVYDALIAVAGAAGAALLVRRWWARGEVPEKGEELHVLLLFWAAASLLLLLATGQKTSGQVVSLLLPMALLGGVGVAALLRDLRLSSLPRIAPFMGALVVLLAFVYVAVGFLTGPGSDLAWLREPLLVLVVGLLAVLAIPARRHLRGSDQAWFAVAGIALLLTLGVHSAIRLRYPSAPELVSPSPTAADVAQVVRRVDEVYWRLRGVREVKMAVASSLQEPLAWYFRDYPNVSFVPRIEPGATIVIALGKEPDQRFSRYLVEKGRWLAPALSETVSWGDMWRWWLYGEGPEKVEQGLLIYIGG